MRKTGQLKILTTIMSVALVSLCAHTAFAFIPPAQTEIDLTGTRIIKPDQPMTPQKVALVIPTDLQQTSNSDAVKNKIFDHSLQSLLQGEYFQDVQILQTAKKFEKAMKANVDLGKSAEGGINHNVEFQVDAFQSKACLKYSGLVDANVTYTSSAGVDMTVTRTLDTNTKLELNHQASTDLSSINMKWSW